MNDSIHHIELYRMYEDTTATDPSTLGPVKLTGYRRKLVLPCNHGPIRIYPGLVPNRGSLLSINCRHLWMIHPLDLICIGIVISVD